MSSLSKGLQWLPGRGMGLVAKGLQKHFDKLARQLLPVALARINDKRALAELGDADCPFQQGDPQKIEKWQEV